MTEIKTYDEFVRLAKEYHEEPSLAVEGLKAFYAWYIMGKSFPHTFDNKTLLLNVHKIRVAGAIYDSKDARIILKYNDCVIRMKDVPSIIGLFNDEKDNPNVVTEGGYSFVLSAF